MVAVRVEKSARSRAVAPLGPPTQASLCLQSHQNEGWRR